MLNTDKLFKILTNNPELQDIPILYISKVTACVISALNVCIDNVED